jgi:2-haloacid dehalogenase
MTGSWTGVRALLFDVLGTVVHEQGSIADHAAAALASAGADPSRGPALAADWSRRTEILISEVAAGTAPWRPNDALRRAALLEAVQGDGLEGLPAAVLDRLALAGHRLAPWPDAAPALQAIGRSRVVIALSNASMAQLASMSAAGGLAWHCVLSAELARAYKPDPAVYRLAIEMLGLVPEQTLMVAAHPWDLRAASRQGLRTAYVFRPGEGTPEPGDEFDVRVGDLAELAQRLPG